VLPKGLAAARLVFASVFACTSPRGEAPSSCANDYQLLRENWQSASFWNGYTEVEITADSLRCYVDHGEYIGATLAEAYAVRHDSLLRVDCGAKYRICIQDSAHVWLTDNLGRAHELVRFSPALRLSQWTSARDTAHKAAFLSREKAF
jgi:hypothetical protein